MVQIYSITTPVTGLHAKPQIIYSRALNRVNSFQTRKIFYYLYLQLAIITLPLDRIMYTNNQWIYKKKLLLKFEVSGHFSIENKFTLHIVLPCQSFRVEYWQSSRTLQLQTSVVRVRGTRQPLTWWFYSFHEINGQKTQPLN